MIGPSSVITVTVFDYGAGNLHSLTKALGAPGVRVRVDADPSRAADRRFTDVLVLPGVGAFATAAQRLAPARDEIRAAIDAGLPVVGICLGMQLLFDASEEGEASGAGLGAIRGVVRRLRAPRVPQIGWNSIEYRDGADGFVMDNPRLDVAYYANSYVCEPRDGACVTSWSTYENDRFPASVCSGAYGNVIGVQFHPEKSSSRGVRFLRALVEWARRQAPV